MKPHLLDTVSPRVVKILLNSLEHTRPDLRGRTNSELAAIITALVADPARNVDEVYGSWTLAGTGDSACLAWLPGDHSDR